MNEATKSRHYFGEVEARVLIGRGIDIGAGSDPIIEGVQVFDIAHGDANEITRYVSDVFDFVYSSHCLEHMRDPRGALSEWWQLVRPGGHLIFSVPDEDLYEQGVFPSRFNSDHKHTFTISKRSSWSPVSVNVLDLVMDLPNGRLVKLELQDEGYDRSRMTSGPGSGGNRGLTRRIVSSVYYRLRHAGAMRLHLPALERWIHDSALVDQTRGSALAQITCILQKLP